MAEEGLRTGSKQRLGHYYFSYAITGYCDASLMAYRIIADRRFRGWGKESYQKLLDAIGNDETLLWNILETQQEASPFSSITDLKWQRLLEGWRCVRLQDTLINAGFDGKSIVRYFQQYDVFERKQLQKLGVEKIHGGNNYQEGDPVINIINRPKLGIWKPPSATVYRGPLPENKDHKRTAQ